MHQLLWMIKMRFDALVIGGGITGLFTALDLSLRGFRVALVERGLIGGGTSGKMHNLIHSGARYVTNDVESATECASEGKVLRRIARPFIRDTGGLFVDVDGDDEFYGEFVNGLKKTGIEYRELSREEALKIEPRLSESVVRAVWVPDGVVYPLSLMTSVAVAAHDNGAIIGQFLKLEAFELRSDKIERAVVRDMVKGELLRLEADVYVNTAGPWVGEVAEKAGVEVSVLPTAGAMVVLNGLLNNLVLNRLRPPSDGDIIVPFNGHSVIGTTASLVESIDELSFSDEEIQFLIEEASAMVPDVKRYGVKAVYGSVRPLIKMGGTGGREVSRKFEVYRHDKPANMVSAVGGKFSTGRLMGESIGNVVARMMGSSKESRTREYVLPELREPRDFADHNLPLMDEDAHFVASLSSTSQGLASDDLWIYSLALISLMRLHRQKLMRLD
jgi:glycerol-3-phosphate dehydrogenase